MGTGLYPLGPSLGHIWLSRYKGERSHLTRRSIATEWATSVLGTVTRPLGFLGLRLTGGTGPRPVILIHGYMMSRASFLVLARRLAAQGLGPIYGFEYWTLGKVGSAATRLGELVDAVRTDTGATEVDLVGHSMGGLVARYYALLSGGGPAVRNLVTIGTPHGGAMVSALGIGRPQVELQPKAAFFSRLGAAPLPDHLRPLVIWSRADALVWDAAQARWPGTEELVFDDLGHVAMLYSRRVAAEVGKRLSGVGL